MGLFKPKPNENGGDPDLRRKLDAADRRIAELERRLAVFEQLKEIERPMYDEANAVLSGLLPETIKRVSHGVHTLQVLCDGLLYQREFAATVCDSSRYFRN